MIPPFRSKLATRRAKPIAGMDSIVPLANGENLMRGEGGRLAEIAAVRRRLVNARMDRFIHRSASGSVCIKPKPPHVGFDFEWMAFDRTQLWSIPVAFVFARGYVGARLSRDSLVGLHRQTISEGLVGLVIG